MAGLKAGNYTGDLNVLDALFISSVFKSDSPSAGAPIGIGGLKTAIESLSGFKPGIFALGGINRDNAQDLIDSGASGIAGISGIIPTQNTSERMAMTDITISKEKRGDAFQFQARIEGFEEIGVLDLKPAGDGVYAATHTGVPDVMGGKGVGSALVKALMEDAQTEGYKIIPSCPFVDVKMKRNKEWEALRA
jgi:predicted GNAT family acetyltransferase